MGRINERVYAIKVLDKAFIVDTERERRHRELATAIRQDGGGMGRVIYTSGPNPKRAWEDHGEFASILDLVEMNPHNAERLIQEVATLPPHLRRKTRAHEGDMRWVVPEIVRSDPSRTSFVWLDFDCYKQTIPYESNADTVRSILERLRAGGLQLPKYVSISRSVRGGDGNPVAGLPYRPLSPVSLGGTYNLAGVGPIYVSAFVRKDR